MTFKPGCLVIANRLSKISERILAVWSAPDSSIEVCYLSIRDVCVVITEEHFASTIDAMFNTGHVMVVTPTNQVGWIDTRDVRPA